MSHVAPSVLPLKPDSSVQRMLPWLRLMRPANVVTAVADVLAGFAASGFAEPAKLPFLILSTAVLYAGGVTLNDVFDAGLDRTERPERPIPSGQVSLRSAAIMGGLLLAGGVAAAAICSPDSGVIALLIASLATLYDGWGKHQAWGPLNMAVCRGLNLMLGLSAASSLLHEFWFLAAIPVLYIGAITLLSRGEVHGGRRSVSLLSIGCIGCVMVLLITLRWLPVNSDKPQFSLIAAGAFIAFFAWRVLPAFWKTVAKPAPDTIRRAVKAGVLSLIVLDSAIAAGFGGVVYGLVVLSLSLAAGALARIFAVT